MEPITIALLVVGAIVGQITHIVKAKVTRSKSELQVFRNWILRRPFNTLSACAVAVGAAYAVQVNGMDPVQIFVLAFLAGYAADSSVNRPGDTKQE